MSVHNEVIDLAYLHSAPLVAGDVAIDNIDVTADIKMIANCLHEANRKVKVRYDVSTVDNLRTIVTKGVRALHYSGHGTPDRSLSFENGMGGLHANFSIAKLKALFQAGGTQGVDFVFVAACNSEYVGEAFAQAGVKHVVAVRCARRGSNLSTTAFTLDGGPKAMMVEDSTAGLVTDRASRVFSHAFYLALFLGRTVSDAFEIGKARVMADIDTGASTDAGKFLLLPRDTPHNQVIFGDLPAGQWEDVTPRLHCRLPPLPEYFLGRNVEMHRIIKSVLSRKRRLTIIRGPPGIGKTSISTAVAHYIWERRQLPAFFVSLEHLSPPELDWGVGGEYGMSSVNGRGGGVAHGTTPAGAHGPTLSATGSVHSHSMSGTSSTANGSATSSFVADDHDPRSEYYANYVITNPGIEEEEHGHTGISAASVRKGAGAAILGTDAQHRVRTRTKSGASSHSTNSKTSSSTHYLGNARTPAPVRDAIARACGFSLSLPFPTNASIPASNSSSFLSNLPGGSPQLVSVSSGISNPELPVPATSPLTRSSSVNSYSSEGITDEESDELLWRHLSGMCGPTGGLLLVIDGGEAIVQHQTRLFRDIFLAPLLANTVSGVKVLLTTSSALGHIRHIASHVVFINPLPAMHALRVFSALCPRRLTMEEIMNTMSVTPAPSESIQSIENILRGHPDLLIQHYLLTHFKGSPGALALAASLLEDLSFSQLQSLIIPDTQITTSPSSSSTTSAALGDKQSGSQGVAAASQSDVFPPPQIILPAFITSNTSSSSKVVPNSPLTLGTSNLARQRRIVMAKMDEEALKTLELVRFYISVVTTLALSPPAGAVVASITNANATTSLSAIAAQSPQLSTYAANNSAAQLSVNISPPFISRPPSYPMASVPGSTTFSVLPIQTLQLQAGSESKYGQSPPTPNKSKPGPTGNSSVSASQKVLVSPAAGAGKRDSDDDHVFSASAVEDDEARKVEAEKETKGQTSVFEDQGPQRGNEPLGTESVAIRRLRGEDSKLQEADTLRSLAVVKIQMGEAHTQDALDHLEEALSTYREQHDVIGEASSLQLRVEVKMSNNSIDPGCEEDLARALLIFQQEKDTSGEAWTLKMNSELNLLFVQERSGQDIWDTHMHNTQQKAVEVAQRDVQRALTIFQEIKDINGEAAALRVRGRVNLSLGNRMAAKSDLEAAHVTFVRTNNVLGDAATLRLLGNLKAQFRDWPGALKDLTESLHKYRQVKHWHRRGEMSCLRSLGDVHFSQGNVDAAAQYLHKALEIVEQSIGVVGTTRVNRREKALILRSLGDVQIARGDLQSGLANLEASIPIFRELNRQTAVEDTQRRFQKEEGAPHDGPGLGVDASKKKESLGSKWRRKVTRSKTSSKNSSLTAATSKALNAVAIQSNSSAAAQNQTAPALPGSTSIGTTFQTTVAATSPSNADSTRKQERCRVQ